MLDCDMCLFELIGASPKCEFDCKKIVSLRRANSNER